MYFDHSPLVAEFSPSSMAFTSATRSARACVIAAPSSVPCGMPEVSDFRIVYNCCGVTP